MNSSNSPPGHALSYRPDIDGLRALAVAGVVFFHASLGCPGGYVGVDVFFVISGYLITALILRDLHAGRFSMRDFIERRIRRIFPALFVMVAVTLLVGAVLFLPGAYEQLGMSAIAQALMVANVFFWWVDHEHGGYFGPASEERPLLHTWSLSVEEQFYLIFPFLLAWIFRHERWRQPRAMSVLMFVGVVLGLLVAAEGVALSAGAGFYLLPTRAWELLCGAWIAALPVSAIPRGRWARESASLAGLAGVLLPVWLYSAATPFPGVTALPPCAGAALLIWSNGIPEDGVRRPTFVGRLLASRPLVFIGLISYSLYLWHWPVLVFGEYWSLQPETPLLLRVSLVAVAGVLAVMSWRWIEKPFREKRVAAGSRAIFRFAGMGSLLSLFVGSGIALTGGLPGRMPESIARNAAAESDKLEYMRLDSSVDDIVHDRLHDMGGGSGAVKILLWGDSHAMHAIPAMEDFCREAGIRGVAAVRGVNPPVLDANFGNPNERNPAHAAAVLEYIRRHRVKDVVLAARWCHYEQSDPGMLKEALSHTIQTLHAMSCRVWVIQGLPDVDIVAAKPLIRDAVFRVEDDSWYRKVSNHRRRNSVVYQLSEQGLPATFIDPAPSLLDAGGECYRPEIEGVSIYHDDDHLTTRASRLVLLPLLRDAISPHLKVAGTTAVE